MLDNMDPTTQALMAAGFGLLGTSGSKGFGRAGLMGLNQLEAAKKMQLLEEESRQREAERRSLEQMRQMQVQQMQAALAEAQRKQAQAGQIQQAARDSMLGPAGVALAGGGGPTVANAAAMNALPQNTRVMDEQGFADRVFEIDPMSGLALRQQMRERNAPVKIGKDDRYGRVEGGQWKEIVGAAPGDQWEQVSPTLQRNSRTGEIKPVGHAPGASVTVQTPFETEYSKESGKQFATMKGEINTAGFRAPATIRSLERIDQLLQGVDGGVLAPTGLEIASAAKSFGISLDPKLGNKEAAEALTREITQSFRQPGTGPQTDKDFENFMKMAPGLAKTAEGRKQIITTLKNKAARDIKIAQMARDYEKRHGRINDGFLDDVAAFVAMQPVVPLPEGWQITPMNR